ncbi:hypothetical protein PGQ11_011616 [Apiospora arundinis]|uniref:Uncharacterized protein n=1 Tax=Apiospora arundinis TaxID=335852 RepID=A0ABR2I071_9PEZI
MTASLRPSSESVDEDWFYSAPSSRLGSRHRHAPESIDYAVKGEAEIQSNISSNLAFDPGFKTSPILGSVVGLRKHHIQSMQPSDPTTLPPKSDRDAFLSAVKTARKCSCDLGNDSGRFGQSAKLPPQPVAIRQPSTTEAGDTSLPPHKRSSPIPIEEIENIVNGIKRYLSYRHHGTCNAAPGMNDQTCPPTPRPSMLLPGVTNTIGAQPHVHEASDTFLVSTNDIAEILDIVIAGLRTIHDKHLTTGCLTAMLPGRTRSRAGTTKKGIVPQCSKPADPATTISSVKSAFSATGYANHGTSHAFRNNKSIIISRQSITECDYTPHTTSSSSGVLIRRENGAPGAAIQYFGLHHNGTPWQMRRPSSTPLPPKQAVEMTKTAASTPIRHDIVSFPPLRSRSCTNDWIAPQLGQENLLPDRHHTPTLYQCGVDAHRGITPAPDTNREPSAADTIFPNSTTSSGGSPTGSPKPQTKKRMGSSIGVATRLRRSSSQQIDQTDQNLGSTLLNSLRRYSLMPLLEQPPEVFRRKASAPKLLEDVPLAGHRRLSSRAMLEDILAKFPSQSTGSRHTSSSSNMSKSSQKASKRSSATSRYRKLSCMEENAPHICVDEQPTPISERSFESSFR